MTEISPLSPDEEPLTPSQKGSPSKVTILPLDAEEEGPDFSLSNMADTAQKGARGLANIANEINYGITSMIPGLNYFTAKYLGIGEDIARGEGGKISVEQGALRMAGMSMTAAYGMLARGFSLTQQAIKDMAPEVFKAMSLSPYVTRAVRAAPPPEATISAAVNTFLQRSSQATMAAPKTTLLAEGAAAISAGAVGQHVYNETDDPTLRAAAEVGTGLLVGVGIPYIKQAASYAPVVALTRRAINSYRFAKQPKRESVKPGELGAQKASERIRGVVQDPDETLAALSASDDVLPDAPLTVAEKSEDQGLLSLEQAIIRSSEELSLENQARFDTIYRVIRESLDEVSGDSYLRPEEARLYLDNLIEERIRIAGVKAAEKLKAMEPTLSRADTNLVVREELENALNDALKSERQHWAAVDKKFEITPENGVRVLKQYFDELGGNQVRSFLSALPKSVKQFLGRVNAKGKFIPGKLAEGGTLQEVQSMRSEILREIRAERAKDAPDRDNISYLSDIQMALLADLDQPQTEAWKLATNFSKDLNARFRQGNVGKILGYEATGEGKVPANLTLERTVGVAGKAGATARESLRQMIRAANTPEMVDATQDYVADLFFQASRLGTDFNPAAAQRFVRSHKELLQEFPELLSRMEAAIQAGNAHGVAKMMKNPSVSLASVILGKTPRNAMESIIVSPSPRESVKAIIKELETDPTGKALPGFQKGVLQWAMYRSSSQSLDSNEMPILLGSKMKGLLDNPNIQPALKEALTPAQYSGFVTATNTALKAEIGKKAQPLADVVPGMEGMIAETVRKVMAAAVGRRAGRAVGAGGTVQIPGQFVAFSNRMTDAGLNPARVLLIEAILSEDPRLIKSLILLPKNDAGFKRLEKHLNAWMVSAMQKYAMSATVDQEEQQ